MFKVSGAYFLSLNSFTAIFISFGKFLKGEGLLLPALLLKHDGLRVPVNVVNRLQDFF